MNVGLCDVGEVIQIMYTAHGYWTLVSDWSSRSDGPSIAELWLAVRAIHRSQLSSHPPPSACPSHSLFSNDSFWCSNFSDNSLISFRASRFFHRNAFWVISIIVSNQLLISGRVTERWSESPCHKRVSVHSADGQKPHWALRDALLLSHLPTSLVSWTLGNLRIFLPFVNVRCHLLNLNNFSD